MNHDTSLFQLDILAADIQGCLTHIADFDGFGDPLPTVFFFMERTPDGRIIMNVLNGSQYLHVIQEPNKKGFDCRFEQHAIKLPTVNNFTLPHFPNYRLGALGEPLCDTLGVAVQEPLDRKQWKVVPNPAYDEIRIESPDHTVFENLVFKVLDAFGKEAIVSTKNQIEIGDLPPGLYFVNIRKNNIQIDTQRFIKLSQH